MSAFQTVKDFLKKTPFVRPLIAPVQLWRARQLKRRKKGEAREFMDFIQAAFTNVEDGSLVVRVPNLNGSFEIDFRSHILLRILRKKNYEEDLITLAARYLNPDKDILDIGANIGLLTVFFARFIKEPHKILAVEPVPLAQYYLRRNIVRNGVGASVIIFDGLVTDKTGDYELNVIPGKEEYSSLGNIVHSSTSGEKYQAIMVKGETVDNLVARFSLHPGFVKIDTEGAELFVLRGAIRILREERPVLLMELSDRLLASLECSSEQVLTLLRECGYHILNADTMKGDISYPFDGSILALPNSEEK